MTAFLAHIQKLNENPAENPAGISHLDLTKYLVESGLDQFVRIRPGTASILEDAP